MASSTSPTRESEAPPARADGTTQRISDDAANPCDAAIEEQQGCGAGADQQPPSSAFTIGENSVSMASSRQVQKRRIPDEDVVQARRPQSLPAADAA